MNPGNFQRALRGFCKRQPFLPFVVELVSGDRFRVTHPEAVSMRGGVAMYVGRDSAVKLFDGESVSQLCDELPPPGEPAQS